jgi:hypothetical protein
MALSQGKICLLFFNLSSYVRTDAVQFYIIFFGRNCVLNSKCAGPDGSVFKLSCDTFPFICVSPPLWNNLYKTENAMN